jgi:hypothetical protein
LQLGIDTILTISPLLRDADLQHFLQRSLAITVFQTEALCLLKTMSPQSPCAGTAIQNFPTVIGSAFLTSDWKFTGTSSSHNFVGLPSSLGACGRFPKLALLPQYYAFSPALRIIAL